MTPTTDASYPNETWLREMAKLEDQCQSISAGGMACDLQLLEMGQAPPPGAFAHLVEFGRRKRGLAVEDLARATGIELPEILAAERNPDARPLRETVSRLAEFLGLPVEPLLEIAGLAEPKSTTLETAAAQFAARAESTASLSTEEDRALEEFIKVIAAAAV